MVSFRRAYRHSGEIDPVYQKDLHPGRLILQEMDELLFQVISLDMIIGMALGMAASPILMRVVKVMRRRMKINSLLKEIAKNRVRDFDSDAVVEGVDN